VVILSEAKNLLFIIKILLCAQANVIEISGQVLKTVMKSREKNVMEIISISHKPTTCKCVGLAQFVIQEPITAIGRNA
jgi:hypothetical protein